MFREKFLPRAEYIRLPFKDRLITLSRTEDERATGLHEKLITICLHSLSISPDDEHPNDHEGKAYPRERVKNSGLTCLGEAIEANATNQYPTSEIVMRQVKWYKTFFSNKPGMIIAYTTGGIREAKKEGTQAVWLGIEGDGSLFVGPGLMLKRGTPDAYYPFLDNIDIFFELGVRRLSPILNFRNYIGDGSLERYDSGLSEYGVAFIERMNKVGMMIDMSHWGEKSSFDAVAISKDPCMVSHAGARALYPKNMRLKSDELVKALSEKGGIIGVCGIPNYLSGNERQGVKDMMDHIDHLVNLVGVDSVGIGLDIIWGDQVASPVTRHYLIHMGLGFPSQYMEGIDSLEEWPNITRGLVSRGYSDQEIEKIVGGNALRMFDEITE